MSGWAVLKPISSCAAAAAAAGWVVWCYAAQPKNLTVSQYTDGFTNETFSFLNGNPSSWVRELSCTQISQDKAVDELVQPANSKAPVQPPTGCGTAITHHLA